MKRYYLMDLEWQPNITDLLRSISSGQLQGLVDETQGIVAYVLPGFDFDTVRHIEYQEGTEE